MNKDSVENVESCMQRDLQAVSAETSVALAASQMATEKIGCLLVQGEDQSTHHTRMIGIVSEIDLVRNVMVKGLPPLGTTVAQIMVSPLLMFH